MKKEKEKNWESINLYVYFIIKWYLQITNYLVLYILHDLIVDMVNSIPYFLFDQKFFDQNFIPYFFEEFFLYNKLKLLNGISIKSTTRVS